MTDEEGPGDRHPGATTTTTSRRQRTDPGQAIRATRRTGTMARSVAYAPDVDGVGRGRWLHVVPACPHCGRAHHHLIDTEHGGKRRAGCRRGSYVVEPVVICDGAE